MPQISYKMKKSYILVFLLSISALVFAQSTNDLDKYLENNKEAYVQVKINSPKDIFTINKSISVDIIDAAHVGLYITHANLDKFYQLGYDYQIQTPPSKLHEYTMYDGSKETYEWDTYPTYEAYISIMEQFAADYPDICQTFSIGNSVEGRELKFVKVSDNVDTREAEPQFLYTGTMHGDETTGFVMFLRLIDYLTSNYGTDAEVTELVDNLEIWINPASNPDGTYATGNSNVWGSTRANANGVNLNRNYPDPQNGPHPDGNEWQPETIAFMNLAEENHFVMAANTHGGAEVVNYPWDTWSQLAPDDEWWQFVSHEFADTAQANSPSGYMNGFNDGITNGYAWYSIDGGRQDYMNWYHNCREVTLEISGNKTIPENQLNNHWNYLHRSFINYMKQCLYGVHGIVTDSLTGDPLAAEVFIDGHDIDESQVYSEAQTGYYTRLLNEGSYDITYSAEGYIPKTINVDVINYETTNLDVQLVSAALIADFTADQNEIVIGQQVQFTEQCYGDPDTYEWTFKGGSPASSSLANPLVTYNTEGAFDVSLTIYSGTDSQTITKEAYIRASEQYLMSNGEATTCSGLFVDDGGLEGNYANNKDFVFTVYGDSDISEAILTVDFVAFNIEDEANCNYDYLKIYNGNSTAAALIGTYCGTNSPGMVEADNSENALTFEFHSDNSVNGPGWRANINCTIIDHVTEIDPHRLDMYPNPNDGDLLKVESLQLIHQISIFSLSGELLKSWNMNEKETEIDLKDLSSGVYLIKAFTQNGTSVEKLIIK
jgi:PKD repeat protein